jgi:hypothetical protein
MSKVSPELEAVACALHAADPENSMPYAGCRSTYITMARAATRALSKPTQNMIDAMCEYRRDPDQYKEDFYRSLYMAALDVICGEKTPEFDDE